MLLASQRGDINRHNAHKHLSLAATVPVTHSHLIHPCHALCGIAASGILTGEWLVIFSDAREAVQQMDNIAKPYR